MRIIEDVFFWRERQSYNYKESIYKGVYFGKNLMINFWPFEA
jgi:hypothetical protein